MKHKLVSKMLLAYLVVGLIGFFLVAIMASKVSYNDVLEEKTINMYATATSIANDTIKNIYNINNTIAKKNIEPELKAIAKHTGYRIVVINDSYDVLIDTDKEFGQYNATRIYNFDPLETGKEIYQIGDFFGYCDNEVVSVKATINYGFRVNGYVTLHYDYELIEQEASERSKICYVIYLCIYGLSFIVLVVFMFEVYKPLLNIIKATKEFEDGNLRHKIEPQDPDDELGRLAISLNYIANEIDEIEDFQKKFIANVSHDFRSPLTSIKGYIEAMMDGTIPVEMQEKYFNIVISETERLNKLTNSMLALNDMGTRGVHLNISEFNINEVVKRTIETFGGICRGKNIQFDLTFSSKELYVIGDVDKIQQVVYNLVDNAIKFSNSDSTISISATERNDKAYISIKDTGIGIPKEEIPKIWDRFYKSDLSRGKDKKGTGLGLCIVKEIIQAHNTNIDVVSTVSVGTEFIFSLPIVVNEEN